MGPDLPPVPKPRPRLQCLLVFMKLRHKPKVRFGNPPLRLYKRHRFCRRPTIQRHQKRTNYACATADPLHTVHKHSCLRVAQRLTDKRSGRGQVRSKFCKRIILNVNLCSVYRCWSAGVRCMGGDVDEARHRRNDMSNA